METTKKEITAAIMELASIARRVKVHAESVELYSHLNGKIGELFTLARHLPREPEEGKGEPR